MSNESLSFSNYMDASDLFVGVGKNDSIKNFSVAISECSGSTATPITHHVSEYETELLFKISCNNCSGKNVRVTTNASCHMHRCYPRTLYIPDFRETG